MGPSHPTSPSESMNQNAARRLTQQRQRRERELEAELARKDNELSLLQSRLLRTLDTIDAHAQENADLYRELKAMKSRVQACEEAGERVQRERDELREEVERLVEKSTGTGVGSSADAHKDQDKGVQGATGGMNPRTLQELKTQLCHLEAGCTRLRVEIKNMRRMQNQGREREARERDMDSSRREEEDEGRDEEGRTRPHRRMEAMDRWISPLGVRSPEEEQEITSLLTTRTTHLTKLSLLQSCLLHALDALDAHTRENADLLSEPEVMRKKVQACEEAKESMQREREELREEVERLVERDCKWSTTIRNQGPGVKGHQPTPPPCSHSHRSSASHHSSPNSSVYAPQLMHLLSTKLSTAQAAHARTQARAATLEARIARREKREIRAGEREIQREREIFLTRSSLLISLYRTYRKTRTRASSSVAAYRTLPSPSPTTQAVYAPPSASPPVPVVGRNVPNLMDNDNEDGDADGKMSMELATPLMLTGIIAIFSSSFSRVTTAEPVPVAPLIELASSLFIVSSSLHLPLPTSPLSPTPAPRRTRAKARIPSSSTLMSPVRSPPSPSARPAAALSGNTLPSPNVLPLDLDIDHDGLAIDSDDSDSSDGKDGNPDCDGHDVDPDGDSDDVDSERELFEAEYEQ
ncbi:hypothetical protein CVT25_010276 [Psilocybe cyanescens]|uniref:Uncharacterized protein n=1 Tax=Psilocybe cyanescens TaxID=93625 RepID=A0A409X2T1_PSICY|nr:hypothetical protein CVT25_010276 [Psilocybe cyanescens]